MPDQTDDYLLFVYNADSGFFNTVVDIGHKLFSPKTYECQLCNLSYGYLHVREDWKTFIGELGMETRFMHRDEFQREFPRAEVTLPAVLLASGQQLLPCISAKQLNEYQRLEELIAGVKKSCVSG